MNTTLDERRLNVVIFLAGFTFLVYEVAWNRLLALVLGATVAASTLVLAAFMAGLGVGAFFWGRFAGGRRRIAALLGLLLAGVGATSALDYVLFTRVAGGLPGDPLVFLVSLLLLIVPSFLMGGVLPLVSKLAIRTDDAIAPAIGRLYALETLGSSLGGLATGFVFLGALGQAKTVALAVAINLLLAAWLLARHRDDHVDVVAASEPQATPRPRRREPLADPAVMRLTALIGTGVCGFAMVGLQVAWLRIFRVYLTNTSYTFALVSSLAILGLFAGSALFHRRAARLGDPQRSLLRVVLLMAATTAVGLVLLVNLPALLMFPFQAVVANPAARVLLLPLVAALLIVVPPAVCSGYAFPLACRMYAAGTTTLSRDVGVVLLINTAGSVAGPLLAAFVLIPVVGAAWAVLVMVVLLAAAAFVFLRRLPPPRAAALDRTILWTLVLAVAGTALVRPDLRIVPPSFSRFGREILFYRESTEGTLIVGQDRGTRSEAKYSYVNNAAVIGSSYDAVKAVKMIGHFPFFLGHDARDVLVIGFGIGVTTSAIAAHPGVTSIECVELVDGLRDAAAYYRDLNRNVVADPRLRFIAGDGRHYLQRTPKTYDLISCDPTHPVFGSSSLYTREYFELCRAHLNPGGVVSQYLPLHKLRTEEFLGLIATFHDVFPNSALWLGHYHAVLVGSLDPLPVDFAAWSAAVAAVGPDKDIYMDPYHYAATLMLDSDAIARLTAGRRLNTDDRSTTEFFAPGCLDEGNLAANMRVLAANRVDPGTIYRNVDDPARLARFVAGNRLLTESLLAKLEGDDRRSLEILRAACEASPEDRELPYLIKLNF
jgi:spermidine synthase